MTDQAKRAVALPCAALLALAVAGCAQSVSTSAFKGEQREVAQTIANLQSNVTAANEQKICSDDLAGANVARLNAAPGGCKQAIKSQLAEVDSLEATVESVVIHAAGSERTASAIVKSVYGGKTGLASVSLIKEDGKWKISGVS